MLIDDARLLYSNSEGVHVLDLRTGKAAVVAMNGEVMDYYFLAYTNGAFRLEGAYVALSDWDLPSIAPVTSPNGNFSYTRSQSGFEGVTND